MITIFLLAIAGAIIAGVLGTFWYSPKTPMGKIHMKCVGFDKLSAEEQKKKMEEAKPTMWKKYLGQMILSFLTAFSVVFIVTLSVKNGLPLSMALIFVVANWLCFMVPIIGSGMLWSTNCDGKVAWQQFFSDIFLNLVTILLIAVLTSFFV
jgi:hypothetical protein